MRIKALIKGGIYRVIHTAGTVFFHRKLVLKATSSHDSARNAKQQMQLFKAEIVHSMNDEYKEMMRQAVDEVTVESLCFQSLSNANT